VRRSYITPDTLSPAYIYVVNADGSNPIRFDHPADVWDGGLAWSPDSTRVAFIRFPFSGQGPLLNDIYTARADGTDLQNVTNSANNSATDSPAWSPDGTQIAFASHGAISLLEVMNADGSNRHPIFNVGSWGAVPAVWSPDGTKLTFRSQVSEGSEGDVYVVNADGSGLIHIGDDRERNIAPDWSPDSQRLVFRTNRNGVDGINIVNADGTGRVDLTTQAGIFGAPKWRPRLPGNTPRART
jgi:TolB protein